MCAGKLATLGEVANLSNICRRSPREDCVELKVEYGALLSRVALQIWNTSCVEAVETCNGYVSFGFRSVNFSK